MRDPYVCFHCGTPAKTGKMKKTFLLFPRLECGECGGQTTFPASTGARVLHWILALIFIVIFIAGLFVQVLMIPGILFIGGFWGIIADWRLRRIHKKKGAKFP
jgi:hypothetical protein